MFQTLKNAWQVPTLRKKLLFTLLIIVLFRVGSFIPVPYLDPTVIKEFLSDNSDTIFGYLNVMSGGGFTQATLFAMSITPYINASIIIQLLTVVIPALEQLAKEGVEGRKKLNTITRIIAVVFGFVQGFAYYRILANYGAVRSDSLFTGLIIVFSFAAGTSLIMWMGEQINDRGVGNGISIILFVGIVSRVPYMISSLHGYMQNGQLNILTLAVIIIIALLMVMFIVLITKGERRIPIQYAKRVVGRKMYGGQSTHIPLKVNMTGVMPVIFANAIVTLPATVMAFLPNQPLPGSFMYNLMSVFNYRSALYAVIYFLLIIFFNYFYVAIQFNPIEIANNLRKNGGFIPGIRPGKPTSDFISKSLSRITLMGAIFLGIIAVLPIGMSAGMGVNIALGGTSILIVIGVALETQRQIESQLLMRHYKGFLE
jgi:preprotein translocase subunit SecY